MNTLISERLAVLAVLNPADLGVAAASTPWLNMAQHNRIVALILGGAITGTLDAKLEQATDAAGTGAKDITGKALTQFAATDDNKQAAINLRQDQLDMANGFDHVRLTLTPTGGTTNLAGAVVLGGDSRYSPPANADSFVETID